VKTIKIEIDILDGEEWQSFARFARFDFKKLVQDITNDTLGRLKDNIMEEFNY
jgi:hypothetical protein